MKKVSMQKKVYKVLIYIGYTKFLQNYFMIILYKIQLTLHNLIEVNAINHKIL